MPISLDRIKAKKITVGVIGLGYVGLPLSLNFAENGVNVIGFDIDKSKITNIKHGRSYLHYVNHGRLKKVIGQKHLSATSDYREVQQCDALLICVPTPLSQHLEPDLRFIAETCKGIAPFLQPGTLISLESTTWPGTTEEVVQRILEEKSPRKVGKDLYLCYSPEREDPGNQSFNTQTIPKLLGAINSKSLKLAKALYSLAIKKVIALDSPKVAEAAKLFENIFRSVNIALVNELKILCEHMKIDVWEVIRAAATKPFGFMPFWPGPGLGGHCIPIDPFYMTWKAKEYGLRTRFIELAGEINRSMPRYVVSKIQDCLNHYGKAVKGSKILIFGLSYKPNIDDIRESPSLELIHLLESKGATVDYHDPYIPAIGKTREYQDLSGKKSQHPSKKYDCFVLATHHTCFSPKEILPLGIPVVDTRNVFPKNKHVFPA